MVKLSDISIIQGGMGIGVSLANLAGAVMKENQMGTLSAANPGYHCPSFYTQSTQTNCLALQEEIKKARDISQGKGMLAVNIMVAATDYEAYCKASVDADAIISGAGLALRLPEYVEGHDILLAPIVSSKKALELICRTWKRRYDRVPDFVVIEGYKAGGHLGFKEADVLAGTCQSNEEILADILDMHLDIPIFVAGGVYTREDIQKYKALGATGVQMGTRFIATRECDAHPNFKKMVIDAKEEDIELVQSPTGFSARAIRNAFTQRAKEGKIPVRRCVNCLTMCNPSDTPYCITEALIKAVQGDMENGLFFIGENGSRVHDLVSVHELMEELL